MQSRPVDKTTRGRWSWVLVALVTILALAPWWRNHVYLRSFFDYGVVMGGIGRINDGQRPYEDFITPIQTGWYGLNGLAEKIGGGTYQAMTFGGAACILVSLAVLLAMLARRWPLLWAAVAAGVLVIATASQHSMLWYNSWGVVLLAVVAWAGAVAPVLRRHAWAWHMLAGGALFFGGINKINMQLMALGLGSAWAVRAALTGRAGWGRAGATVAFYLGCGALAVLAEMIWTGASFATWWHNVIALPVAGRTSMVSAAFGPQFLFGIIQDHYGPQALPQSGLIALVATILTVVAIWRKTWNESDWLEKILPAACGVIACLGGAVLLTTNMDISYIGVAGWLALLVALWLGYELPARGPWFYGALVVPLLLVGTAAWYSAWKGQRSQFGHSHVPRSGYVAGERAGPEFEYLRGTLLPPEMVDSLHRMAEWRQSLSPERRSRVFYGPGTEWAARIWPAMRTPGLPNYFHLGGSIGAAEADRLHRLIRGGPVSEITVSRVADLWQEPERMILEHRYEKHPLGSMFSVYSRDSVPGVSIEPVWFTRIFGGNADARYLISEASFLPMSSWRMFLGVTRGKGAMRLEIPSNRLQGEVVVRRMAGAARVPAAVDFAIYAQGSGAARYERWTKRVELPANQDEILVPYAIDSSHLPTTFEVMIPPELSGMVAAGWRGPHIDHTGQEGPNKPDWLFRGEAVATALDEAALAKLLPGDWRPAEAWMRRGRVTAEGIELSPGGEIWLRVPGGVMEFAGMVQAVAPLELEPGKVETVRGMWYGGGRLEVFTDETVRATDRMAGFHAWCAEPGGWLIVAVDPSFKAPAVRVSVQRVTQK